MCNVFHWVSPNTVRTLKFSFFDFFCFFGMFRLTVRFINSHCDCRLFLFLFSANTFFYRPRLLWNIIFSIICLFYLNVNFIFTSIFINNVSTCRYIYKYFKLQTKNKYWLQNFYYYVFFFYNGYLLLFYFVYLSVVYSHDHLSQPPVTTLPVEACFKARAFLWEEQEVARAHRYERYSAKLKRLKH